jgi:hypothetical protein
MSTEIPTPSEPTVRAERSEDHVVVRFPRPGRFLRTFLPDEAVGHLLAARREQLLAVRSMLDAAIGRVEAAERRTAHHQD